MNPILFTAPGCVRCRIARNFMQHKGIAYEEHDALGGGKERFGQFYRTHRSSVVRGKEGVEFPVLVEGTVIRQGVAAAVAYLEAGTALDGYIGRSEPLSGWIGGIHLSAGDPAALKDLEAVLLFFKNQGLKLRLDTDGRNAEVLEHLGARGIGDRVVMEIKGPPELYPALAGCFVDTAEISRSMTATTRFPDRRFETKVAPIADAAGVLRYLTPEEIAATACWLKEATGSSKQPYFLRRLDPSACTDQNLRAAAPLPRQALLRHRSAARLHQVFTEIADDSDAG
jgi:pyruvate formate lyase activating enzyme